MRMDFKTSLIKDLQKLGEVDRPSFRITPVVNGTAITFTAALNAAADFVPPLDNNGCFGSPTNTMIQYSDNGCITSDLLEQWTEFFLPKDQFSVCSRPHRMHRQQEILLRLVSDILVRGLFCSCNSQRCFWAESNNGKPSATGGNHSDSKRWRKRASRKRNYFDRERKHAFRSGARVGWEVNLSSQK